MLGANPLPGKEEELNVTTAKILSTTTESVLIEEDSLIVKKNETFLNETKVEEFVCAFYNPDFIIYSSLGSFYIPCVIMVFLYIRIFSVSILCLQTNEIFGRHFTLGTLWGRFGDALGTHWERIMDAFGTHWGRIGIYWERIGDAF